MLVQKLKPTKFNSASNVDLSKLLRASRQRWNAFPTLSETIPTLPDDPEPSHPYLFLDNVTYTKLVQSSTRTGSLIHGKLAHAHMIKTSFQPCLFLLNNLLFMYGKCGDIFAAQKLFDKMSNRNVISYNSLISGYSQMGLYDNVVHAFGEARMAGLKLDKFTYVGVLGVCSHTEDAQLGKQIHSLVIVSGFSGHAFLINSLICMYSNCSQIEQARLLFETSTGLDDVSWNSMIAGYVQLGVNKEVFKLLMEMHRSGLTLSAYTLGSALKACCVKNLSQFGKMLHGYTVKDSCKQSPPVVNMHKKHFIFSPRCKGYVQNGQFENALSMFHQLLASGRIPDEFIISSVMGACADMAAARSGEQIQGYALKSGIAK